ncbi:MAG: NTP transferase domain-containing protein [Coriobacteriales bacterium]|jgi:UTP--glucose-1-phosphate uridylyltransferase|nr:NTP transferase domain-containing protein [Coriobacteriales bacterium]
MKAVIPAAGLGTRFLPATKAQPKEMLPVLERPALQYVVEEALAAGVSEVIVVSNDDKPSIREHFSPNVPLFEMLSNKGKTSFADAVAHAGGLPVSIVPQPEPLGLGHAVHCAADAVGADEPFFVLLGDVLVPDNGVLVRMKEVSESHGGASVIAVLRVPREEVSRFGVIDGEPVAGGAVWRVRSLVEKPPCDEAPSELAVFGRYLLTPRVMELLVTTAPGAGGEIQLTDALLALLSEEELYAIEVAPDEGYDTGTLEAWLDTNIRLALRDPALAPVVRAAVGAR